jgi:hypothetical protein
MNQLGLAILRFEVIVEGITAVALLLVPGVVAQLLFGADLPAMGAIVARVAGIPLLSLVLCCWFVRQSGLRHALGALLAYNIMTAAYLGLVGIQDATLGSLLWPAVVVHAVVVALLAMALRQAA